MKITRTTNRQRIKDSFALYGADGQELAIGDIAKASGLTRTQVHGAAWVLAKEGYLQRISEGVYALAGTTPVPESTPPRHGFIIPPRGMADPRAARSAGGCRGGTDSGCHDSRRT